MYPFLSEIVGAVKFRTTQFGTSSCCWRVFSNFWPCKYFRTDLRGLLALVGPSVTACMLSRWVVLTTGICSFFCRTFLKIGRIAKTSSSHCRAWSIGSLLAHASKTYVVPETRSPPQISRLVVSEAQQNHAQGESVQSLILKIRTSPP